jgi:hypothetical protein
MRKTLLPGPGYSFPPTRTFSMQSFKWGHCCEVLRIVIRPTWTSSVLGFHVREILRSTGTGQSIPPNKDLLNAKLYARPLLQGPAYSFPAHKDLLSAMPYVRTLQEHCCQVPVTGFPSQLRQNAPLFLDTVPAIPNCLILHNVSEGFSCTFFGKGPFHSNPYQVGIQSSTGYTPFLSKFDRRVFFGKCYVGY